MDTCPYGTHGASADVPWSATPKAACFILPSGSCGGRAAPAAARLADGRPPRGGVALVYTSFSARPIKRRWPATIAGGVYLASPFLLAHTAEGHYPHVWAACWYPWAFWAFMQQRGRVKGLLILPLVLAMTYLTGHPQEWYLLVLALSVWTLVGAIGSLRSTALERRFAGSSHGPE